MLIENGILKMYRNLSTTDVPPQILALWLDIHITQLYSVAVVDFPCTIIIDFLMTKMFLCTIVVKETTSYVLHSFSFLVFPLWCFFDVQNFRLMMIYL